MNHSFKFIFFYFYTVKKYPLRFINLIFNMMIGYFRVQFEDHPTFPLLMVAALMSPFLVLNLIPCQTTYPSASVLKCSRHFSTTFLFGFKTGKRSPCVNNPSCPSKNTLSPIYPSGINNST